VSVDLALGSPSAHVPSDITSILYVACSRVTELKNLFVTPIHPDIWKQLGNSETDKLRRLHEEQLIQSSAQFARRSSEHICANQIDFLQQYKWEHADDTTPGMPDALDREWDQIRAVISPPSDANILAATSQQAATSTRPRDDLHSPSWMKPVLYVISLIVTILIHKKLSLAFLHSHTNFQKILSGQYLPVSVFSDIEQCFTPDCYS